MKISKLGAAVLLFLVFAGATLALADQTERGAKGTRQRQNMAGVWRCQPDWENRGEQFGYADPNYDVTGGWYGGPGSRMWREVNVPCSYETCGPDIRRRHGLVWFRRSFHVPKDWQGKRIIIRFEGVNWVSRYWINGKHVFDHPDGLLQFEIPVSDVIQYGMDNVLVVRTDNTPRPGNRAPGLQWGMFPDGGIIRDVQLIAMDRFHIESARFTHAEPNDKAGKFALKINVANNRPEAVKGKVQVQIADRKGSILGRFAADTAELGAGENRDVLFEGTVPGVKPWSPDHPNLYVAKVSLELGDHRVDHQQCRFGFRKIETRGEKLYLNGKPIFLYGINRHDWSPRTGMAVDLEAFRSDLLKIKDLGCNFLRIPCTPAGTRELDLCDEIGILVMEENNLHWWCNSIAPGDRGGEASAHFRGVVAAATRQIPKMIHRDMNHPSIIFWSVSNEVGMKKGVVEALKKFIRLAKQLDPSRLVVQIHYRDGAFDLGDVACLNYYDRDKAGWVQRLSGIHKSYPGKPILVTEFGYRCTYGKEDQEQQSRTIEEAFSGMTAPYVCGATVYQFSKPATQEAKLEPPNIHFGIRPIPPNIHYGIFNLDDCTPRKAAAVVKRMFAERKKQTASKAATQPASSSARP